MKVYAWMNIDETAFRNVFKDAERYLLNDATEKYLLNDRKEK